MSGNSCLIPIMNSLEAKPSFLSREVDHVPSHLGSLRDPNCTMPEERSEDLVNNLGQLKCRLPSLVERYMPWIRTIPLKQGIRFVPIGAQHTARQSRVTLRRSAIEQGLKEKYVNVCSIFPAFLFELGAYVVRFIHAYGEQWSSGILWAHRIRYALDVNKKVFSGNDITTRNWPTHRFNIIRRFSFGNSMNQPLLSVSSP